MGAYIRTRFCVSNISHLLTLFLYNTRLIYKHKFIYGWAYIRNGESASKSVGLYMGRGGLYSGGLYSVVYGRQFNTAVKCRK